MPSKDAGSVKGRINLPGAQELASKVKLAIEQAEERGRANAYRSAAQAMVDLVVQVAPRGSRVTAVADFRTAAVILLTNRAIALEQTPHYATLTTHIEIDPSQIEEGDQIAHGLETWYLTKRSSDSGPAPEVSTTPTIAEAQAAVAWMSARADDICGDTQREEWARQIVTLDRFIFRLSMRAIDPPHVSGLDPELLESNTSKESESERGPWADVLPPDCWICGREVSDSPLVRRVVHRQCEEGRLVALEDAQKKAADAGRVRSLALTARAIGIATEPDGDGWPKNVLPQKDRDALVKAADLVLEDLPALRAMLPKRESEKEKADPEFPLGLISHEETQAKLQRARHVEAPPDTVLLSKNELASPPKMLRCDPCTMWHRPPACTKEGAKT